MLEFNGGVEGVEMVEEFVEGGFVVCPYHKDVIDVAFP